MFNPKTFKDVEGNFALLHPTSYADELRKEMLGGLSKIAKSSISGDVQDVLRTSIKILPFIDGDRRNFNPNIPVIFPRYMSAAFLCYTENHDVPRSLIADFGLMKWREFVRLCHGTFKLAPKNFALRRIVEFAFATRCSYMSRELPRETVLDEPIYDIKLKFDPDFGLVGMLTNEFSCKADDLEEGLRQFLKD